MLSYECEVRFGSRRSESGGGIVQSVILRSSDVFMDEDTLAVVGKSHHVLVKKHVDVRSEQKPVIQRVISGLGMRDNVAGFEYGFFVGARKGAPRCVKGL